MKYLSLILTLLFTISCSAFSKKAEQKSYQALPPGNNKVDTGLQHALRDYSKGSKRDKKIIYKIRFQIMENNQSGALKLLKKYKALNVNIPDTMGYSLLPEAVINLHAELVTELLERGADPNLEFARGPVLVRAAAGYEPEFQGRAIEGRLRIIAREDPRMLDEQGILAEIKILREDKALLQQLKKRSEVRIKSQMAILQSLYQAGVSVDRQDEQGKNALHQSMREYLAPIEQVRYLIKMGVPVNAKDSAGKTPLDYALLWNKRTGEGGAILKLLKKNGALPGKKVKRPAYKKPEPVVLDQQQDNSIDNGTSQALSVKGDKTQVYGRLQLNSAVLRYQKNASKPGKYKQYVITDQTEVSSIIATLWPKARDIHSKNKVSIEFGGEKLIIIEPRFYKNGNLKEGILLFKNDLPVQMGELLIYFSRHTLIEFYPGGQIKAATVNSSKRKSDKHWAQGIKVNGGLWTLPSVNKVIFNPQGKVLTAIRWNRPGYNKGPVNIHIQTFE